MKLAEPGSEPGKKWQGLFTLCLLLPWESTEEDSQGPTAPGEGMMGLEKGMIFRASQARVKPSNEI